MFSEGADAPVPAYAIFRISPTIRATVIPNETLTPEKIVTPFN